MNNNFNLKKYIKFDKNIVSAISKLATGAIVAQVISLIASPISTRIFSSQELGVYTLILTVISLFGPIICLRYDVAIVAANNEKECKSLMILSLFISIISTMVVFIGYKSYLRHTPEIIESIGNFAFLVIPLLFITGLTNILNSYNNKKAQYSLMGYVQVLRSFSQNIIMIISGIFNLGAIGLLISQIIGSFVGIKKQSQEIINNLKEYSEITFNDLKFVAKKYNKQIFFSTPSIFIGSANYSFLNFIISDLFGIGIFGYYSLTYRIMGLPLSIIGINISKVFFQKAMEEKKTNREYNNIFRKISVMLIIISACMVIGIHLLGPWLFEFVFGDEWRIAGEYAKILAPMFGIRLIVSSLSPVFLISDKQHIELLLQFMFIVSLFILYYLGKVMLINELIYLNIINIVYSIIYILFYCYMYALSKK
ncbi:lipopolysaccharide biosynthesis protein [Turicibacter bilis]|uniref:lipopolysaccharide biosynthesis protein n=1 Tax=Turicibacter bilis TaxID=2735723 RepID=UPI003F89EE24